MKKILLIILVIFSFLSAGNAQIVFDQVGLGTSYWLRSYSTPDERVLMASPPTENGDVNPVIIPHIYGHVKLGDVFGFRAKLGLAKDIYQSNSTIGEEIVRSEKIAQTIIPVGFMLDFSVPFPSKMASKEVVEGDTAKVASKSKTSFIGGLGVNRYFIQHTFSREITGGEGTLPDSKFSGNDFGFTGMLGITNQIAERVIFTFFTQYNTGSYDNRVYSEEVQGSYQVKTISLQGLEFGISLGYQIGK